MMANNNAPSKGRTMPTKQQRTDKPIRKPAVNIKSCAATDGVDHININNNDGKTELGRLLHNFSRTPFTHPEYGPFVSIEGFWHWIRSESPDDEFRGLFGDRARSLGRNTKSVLVENFKTEIVQAVYYKIVQTPEIYNALIESTLPFKHYYFFGPKRLEITPEFARWFCDGIEKIRDHLKKHGKDEKVPFVYKEK